MGKRPPTVTLPSDSPRIQEDKKAIWNELRSPSMADFYTIGYSRRTIDEFVAILRSAGVATLIDVRHTPASMYKPEFSKRNLVRRLESEGIDYLHLPQLGVPRDVRLRAAEVGSLATIWDWYDTNVAAAQITRNLTDFWNMAVHPVALMCVEFDPTSCHRHRLSVRLEEYGLTSFDL